jgi:hypothetical protein
MPDFLPEFTAILGTARDAFKAKLQHTLSEGLEVAYKFELAKAWRSLPPADETQALKICAVDGSNQVRDFANGAHFYLVRALGITNYGTEFRSISANIIESRGIKQNQFSNFILYKMEFAELDVIKQFLESIPAGDYAARWICFLDGALSGRILHQVMEFLLDEEQDLLVKYHRLLQEVFGIAKAKGVLLVGVTKDSTRSVLRDLLLQQVGKNHIDTSPLAAAERTILARAFQDCESLDYQDVRVIRKALTQLEAKYGPTFIPLKDVLLERLFHYGSDYALIMRCRPGLGYSLPAVVGPSRLLLKKYFSQLASVNATGFAKRSFRNFLAGLPSGETEFITGAAAVYTGILNYPAIATFTMFLEERDIPIRIEFPAWFAGCEETVGEFKGPHFLNTPEALAFVKELMQLYLTFYAGVEIYHVFLHRVDELVKISRNTMDDIYEKLLEKELDMTLIHTRDYRRVTEL